MLVMIWNEDFDPINRTFGILKVEGKKNGVVNMNRGFYDLIFFFVAMIL